MNIIRTHRIGTVIMALALLTGVAMDVEASSRRRGGRILRLRASAEVVAALTPVGAASGWGRIKVEETTGGPVAGREIDVDLFGLEPGTEHSVEIDGVHLGSVMTDSVGWATLKLESPDDGHPPVPADLPPIGDLQTVLVRDDSAAFASSSRTVTTAATTTDHGGGRGDDPAR